MSESQQITTAPAVSAQSWSIPSVEQLDPLKTAHGVYITVHGHFYQPPRENPYLDAVERQPSAAPCHDWNERIHHECYRPNAFARILNDRNEVIRIVNNYEYISFNMGPTLMNWLERYDIETYQRILEADRVSCQRLNGHGNAVAQAYNHIILPLANTRDKITQIRWGKEDFRSRFGRDPEGMWLAETAVDYPTLEVLVAEGIRFIILAPSQAQRCRPLPSQAQPDPQWLEVGGGQIDPTRPYRCFLPGGDRDRDYIDIFFYDGPISRDMGFNNVLTSSGHFAGRIGQAVRGDRHPCQIVSVATDGETFGHHKGGAEKALAYALVDEFPRHGWTVTNYAHYLSISPSTWEVELKPVTAWSCSHGVNRWQDDCGCGGGGLWHQQWRRPLRDTLNWLRDQLIKVYQETGRELFQDPWLARDQYIRVLRDRSTATVKRFLSQHQARKLSATERVDALRLLEMQRHAMFMYTSCGWFFDELSRPEGTQILRYASRAIELAADVAGVELEAEFIKRLEKAPSNVECFGSGAEVYRKLVIPAQVSLEQVAAHYAISSLFTTYDRDQRIYCYIAHQSDYQLQRIGPLALAVGQLQLTSEITHEKSNLVFAVLHLGGWDFHCCIQPIKGRRVYTQIKERLFAALQQASAAQTILVMNQMFGDQVYSLQTLFAEERHRIMRLLSRETLTRLDQLYTQVYRDNYGVLMAFHREELDVPQELQVAAEVALSHRALSAIRLLEQEASDPSLNPLQTGLSQIMELEAIAIEASHFHCKLNIPGAKETLQHLVLRSLWQLLHEPKPMTMTADIEWLSRLIDLGKNLQLGLALDRAQELYLGHLQDQVVPQLTLEAHAGSAIALDKEQARQLLDLGQKLSVDIRCWLHQLEASSLDLA
jgi:alpha-amylase/alpha-mannosidase (GH57 family)